jgi:predicted SprT family Zn-dependent metalloprotease
MGAVRSLLNTMKTNPKTQAYICNVCSLRFTAIERHAEDGEYTFCPRCRTPLVRPVIRGRKNTASVTYPLPWTKCG